MEIFARHFMHQIEIFARHFMHQIEIFGLFCDAAAKVRIISELHKKNVEISFFY